ncbi:MAG: hypothetical protein IJX69_01065 [Oscillospiraceae bacterium]|nr:hypothetical protein [Oscillospiraceae bacterium]
MRYCRICGRQFVGDEQFCAGCGIAASVDPEESRKTLLRDFILGIVCGLLVCALIAALVFWVVGRIRDTDKADTAMGQRGTTFEGEGFASPEDAIEAYLAALSQGDVAGMTSTFAVETFVDNFDVETMLERNSAYSVSMYQIFRNDNGYTQALNVARRYASVTTEFSEAYFTITGNAEKFGPVSRVESGSEAEFMDAIMEAEWLEILADMEVNWIYMDGEMTKIDEKLDPAGEQLSKLLPSYMDMYGCEAYSMALVDLTIDGQDYLLSLDVACYDGVWYICQQSGLPGTLLGMDGTSGGFALNE